MCGITGLFETKPNRSRGELHNIVQTMNTTLTHRGPDASGLWQDPDCTLVLGHRRLSILDPSDDGAQPMISQNQRYVIIYNGEIYNHQQIAKKLAQLNTKFKGHSDTEILLAAFESWGIDKTLEQINGMFALTLWDRKTRTLHCARDHIGKKPLYIGWANDTLVIASELKAMRAHPDFNPQINQTALDNYLQRGYIEAPNCIYEHIWHLPPAHKISLNLQSLTTGENLTEKMHPYWSAADTIQTQKQTPHNQSESSIIEKFDTLLSQCVKERMIADVPLGAFLSGGIDSSTIAALMQKNHAHPIKTYAIGFEDKHYNEAPYAAKIAAHLKTDHHEHICTATDAINLIPKLPEIYDEPFADISAIPTSLVSQFAKNDVTVTLSGDGGDEMLGGYTRHTQGSKIWNIAQKTPPVLRTIAANTMHQLSKHTNPQQSLKLKKAAQILTLNSEQDAYTHLLTKGLNTSYKKTLITPNTPLTFAEKMMFWDTTGYLPHCVLTKLDRATMATSIEARAPLLDKKIFEYVWQLPLELKIRNGKGKWLLRQILKQHVPESLFERPKQGFNMPISDWLRNDLKDWANDLLTNINHEHLDTYTPQIQQMWASHLNGDNHHTEKLWTILMFQAWYKRWM